MTSTTGTSATHGVAAGAAWLETTLRGPAPVLVMLPGLHGTCALMQDFAAQLGDRLVPLAIDYPVDRVMDHAELTAWMLPRLPTDRPFVLLGESFSGPVAIRLAAAKPRGLVGLVLSASFASSPRPLLSPFAALARAMSPRAVPMRVYEYWLLGRWTNARLRREFAEVLALVQPKVLAGRVVACLREDVRGCLGDTEVPLLYLRGKRARLVPRRAGDDIARAVPGMRVVALDGPHCLLQAIPGQAARVVREFVAKL